MDDKFEFTKEEKDLIKVVAKRHMHNHPYEYISFIFWMFGWMAAGGYCLEHNISVFPEGWGMYIFFWGFLLVIILGPLRVVYRDFTSRCKLQDKIAEREGFRCGKQCNDAVVDTVNGYVYRFYVFEDGTVNISKSHTHIIKE